MDISQIEIVSGQGNKKPLSWSFVPKNFPDDLQPWVKFGSSREEYEKWVPEVCGVCCVKMVEDSYLKSSQSLWHTTQDLTDLGGFKENASGIKGIYHQSIVDYLESKGLSAHIVSIPTVTTMYEPLTKGVVILSIQLEYFGYEGSHLILVHQGDARSRTFRVHDPSRLFNGEGKDISIDEDLLTHLSNRKGVFVY